MRRRLVYNLCMALVRCPDCGKEISDAAPSCIHCGRPRAAQIVGDKVQTVELTAKRYKGQQLLGVILLVVAVVVAIASGGHNAIAGALSSLMFLGGLSLWIAGRFGAWWHHS